MEGKRRRDDARAGGEPERRARDGDGASTLSSAEPAAVAMREGGRGTRTPTALILRRRDFSFDVGRRLPFCQTKLCPWRGIRSAVLPRNRISWVFRPDLSVLAHTETRLIRLAEATHNEVKIDYESRALTVRGQPFFGSGWFVGAGSTPDHLQTLSSRGINYVIGYSAVAGERTGHGDRETATVPNGRTKDKAGQLIVNPSFELDLRLRPELVGSFCSDAPVSTNDVGRPRRNRHWHLRVTGQSCYACVDASRVYWLPDDPSRVWALQLGAFLCKGDEHRRRARTRLRQSCPWCECDAAAWTHRRPSVHRAALVTSRTVNATNAFDNRSQRRAVPERMHRDQQLSACEWLSWWWEVHRDSRHVHCACQLDDSLRAATRPWHAVVGRLHGGGSLKGHSLIIAMCHEDSDEKLLKSSLFKLVTLLITFSSATTDSALYY